MRSGLQQNGLRDLCDLRGELLINKKRASFFEDLVEFRRRHFSNGVENHVLFDCEESLRPNEAGLTDLAAFTIAVVQRYGERIPMRTARDLAQDQIRCRPTDDIAAIVPVLENFPAERHAVRPLANNIPSTSGKSGSPRSLPRAAKGRERSQFGSYE